MDKLDIRLLELLQKDGRMTISELSKQLALSRPSISERIHRLIEKGIIEGFTARISPSAVGRDILLFIQISGLKVSADEFEELVKKESDILECHRITGDASYLLGAAVAGMKGMRALIDRLMPYAIVNTSTVLTSPVPYRSVLPPKGSS
ncbi:Lrp/AsnC family transcriptional regulator [Terrilactibacillus laevilacticus]|uniref:Lrp/AsnC family transcriptional regulator n=1 Tax=Terrilactibacillus laevilacticus TaxID=1380157 RepID=A0ABW5PQX8_9BACI|nr:Lrp/AsnC family transcriptional regulator [Terrilactibacillus laevilacticus]